MAKVAGDITKTKQTCTTSEESTEELIGNVISQALSKPQDITPPSPTLDSRSSWTSDSSYEANWTLSRPTTNYNMPQQSDNNTYHLQRPYETHTSPQA